MISPGLHRLLVKAATPVSLKLVVWQRPEDDERHVRADLLEDAIRQLCQLERSPNVRTRPELRGALHEIRMTLEEVRT